MLMSIMPLRRALVLLEVAAELHDPGVVDEDVQRAELLLGLVDEALERVAVGDVELERDRAAADLLGRPAAASRSRSPIATSRALARRARAAVALPMPRAPPVIAATWPTMILDCLAIAAILLCRCLGRRTLART